MSSTANRWRAPLTGAVAGLVVAAAIVGPSALASGGSPASRPAAAKAAHASAASCPAAEAKARGGSNDPSGGPGPGPFLAAVAQLEQEGTIDATQANVLDGDIAAGSIDPGQLVTSGTLTSAQMRAVNGRLVAVKSSLAAATHDTAAGQGKTPQG